MNKRKLEKYKKSLLGNRQDYQAELQKIANGEKNKDLTEAKDSVDIADSSYTADYNMARTQKINRRIRQIDDVLGKIKDGTYGICEICGENIPEGRLNIRPRALYCIACKEDLEKRGGIK